MPKDARIRNGDSLARAISLWLTRTIVCCGPAFLGVELAMGWEVGYGREGKTEYNASQYEMRTSWEVTQASQVFQRIFKTNLLQFVGNVEKVFAPPQSAGLLFEFGPGMRDTFAKLIRDTAFPAGGPGTSGFAPDDPGINSPDAWWRKMASGAAIGASFREEGTLTSMHIAFNQNECDVHVDRNGFVVTEGGYTHWNLVGLLRHLTMDLAGDKLPWVMLSATYVNKRNQPIFQATLSPWLEVDLPERDSINPPGVKIGLTVTGTYGSSR